MENDIEEDTDDEIERVLREKQQAKREKDDTAKVGVTTPKKKNESTTKEETDRETKRGKYERKENREEDCSEEVEEEAARARQPKRPPSRGQSRQVFPVFLSDAMKKPVMTYITCVGYALKGKCVTVFFLLFVKFCEIINISNIFLREIMI